METGSAEDVGLVTDGDIGGGHRDSDGDCFGGRGCDMIVGNSTQVRGRERGLKIKPASTKTTTAPLAQETDRIVNIGLVVAFLGLLSVLC